MGVEAEANKEGMVIVFNMSSRREDAGKRAMLTVLKFALSCPQ